MLALEEQQSFFPTRIRGTRSITFPRDGLIVAIIGGCLGGNSNGINQKLFYMIIVARGQPLLVSTPVEWRQCGAIVRQVSTADRLCRFFKKTNYWDHWPLYLLFRANQLLSRPFRLVP
jgi:hypothetical protein